MTSGSARNYSSTSGKATTGGAFDLKNNSSLIGFKGTEDLGNGLKGLFQFETNVNAQGGTVAQNNGTLFGSARDTYVGLNNKYGTVLGGYLSTPFRSTLTSFDVMPGATGDGRIENMLGKVRMGGQSLGYNAASTGFIQADASIRATALAYALPTMYGFNGSIAYTGSANNGSTNQTTQSTTANAAGTALTSQTNVLGQGALSMNLGWEGYGVAVKGAYQQAKVNGTYSNSAGGATATTAELNVQGYTSYLIGAAYTGVPGLKVSAVYNRNTVGTNQATSTSSVLDGGAAKGSNNAVFVGASYRFGNNEPRLSYQNVSNTSGLSSTGYTAQDGASQWTANWGYYLSKRTQVYGLVSGIKNNANGVYNMASGGTNLNATGGQSVLTYGAGLRTNF